MVSSREPAESSLIDTTKLGFPESCHDLYSREYHFQSFIPILSGSANNYLVAAAASDV